MMAEQESIIKAAMLDPAADSYRDCVLNAVSPGAMGDLVQEGVQVIDNQAKGPQISRFGDLLFGYHRNSFSTIHVTVQMTWSLRLPHLLISISFIGRNSQSSVVKCDLIFVIHCLSRP